MKMSSLTIGVVIAIVVSLCCSLPADTTTPVKQADITKSLMTNSLLWSAVDLYHSPDAVARGGRVLAIADYLEYLDSPNWRAQRFLCDVSQTCGDFKSAAVQAKKQLNEFPNDYTTGLQWLRFTLDSLNTATQRIDLLTAMLEKDKIPAELRGEIAMELARVYQGRGNHDLAMKALDKALQLDPLNEPALLSKIELTDNPSDKLKVQTMLLLLRGNPRDWMVASELAAILAKLGLADQAVKMYGLAWDVWYSTAPQVGVIPFANAYLNAMLDAGKPARAIQIFSSLEKTLKSVEEFESLMLEAYRDDGLERHNPKITALEASLLQKYEMELTKVIIDENLDKNEQDKPKQSPAAAHAAEMIGWYYMLATNRPQQALQYARKAKLYGASGEGLDALIGIAQLNEKTPQKDGGKLLAPLAEKHSLPAAYLSNYFYNTGDAANGEKYLRMGLKLTHSGLAYRKLRRLAAKHKITVTLTPEAKELKGLIDDINPEVVKLALTPQEYLKISVTPTAQSFTVGEPIHVKVTAINTGQLPIKVGRQGVISQRLGFVAKTVGNDTTEFLALPVAAWQAPRYLAPGETISTIVRLDAGSLEKFLQDNPLATINLQVQGLASPLEYRDTVIAQQPLLNPAPIIIRRVGLISKNTSDAYTQAMQQIPAMLDSEQIITRMIAARRIAAMLGYERLVAQKKTAAPTLLRNALNKPALLGLLGLAIKDKEPVVRGEMVASLGDVDLDPEILNALGVIVEDPSEYVRFRMAELIGGSDTKGRMQLIKIYLLDKSKLVNTMAKAFLRSHQIEVMKKMRDIQIEQELEKQKKLKKPAPKNDIDREM